MSNERMSGEPVFRHDPQMFVCMDASGCYHVSWNEKQHRAKMESLGTTHGAAYSLRSAPTPAKAVRADIAALLAEFQTDVESLTFMECAAGSAPTAAQVDQAKADIEETRQRILSAPEDAPQQDVVAVPRDVLDRMVPVYEPWMDKHDQDGRAWVSSTRYTLGDIKVLRAALSHPSTPATGSDCDD